MINLVNSANTVGLEKTFQSNQVERFIICYQYFGTTTWLTETLLSLINVNDVEVHQKGLLNIRLITSKHVG